MPRPSRYSPPEKAAFLTAARQMMAVGVKRKDVAANLEIPIATLTGLLREQTLDLLLPPLEPTQNPRVRAEFSRQTRTRNHALTP
mgnify:CR=1 FL=1